MDYCNTAFVSISFKQTSNTGITLTVSRTMVTLCLYRFLQANEQLWDLFDPLEDYGSVAVASIFTSKRTTLESGLTVTSSRTMATLRLYRCLQAIGQLWDEFDLLRTQKREEAKKRERGAMPHYQENDT